jgi:predicted O-methyltransferase YrrM
VHVQTLYLPNREQQLLLQAALWSSSAAIDAWARWQASIDFDSHLDDDSFALLPMLYTNLHRHGVTHPLMHKLKGIYRRLWCENQVHFQVVAGVVRDFHLANIPTLLLNGAALSVKYYREDALRTMRDSRIVVPVDRAEQATQLLIQSGWKAESNISEACCPFQQTVTFLNGSDLRLEICWDPSFENHGKEDQTCLWRDAIPITIAKVPTHTLGPTATLRHTLLGGPNRNLEPGIGWIADATTVLNSRDLKVDWIHLMDTARKRRLVFQLKTRVGLLHELFHTLVPSTVVAEVQEMPQSYLERMEARYRRAACGASKQSLLGAKVLDLVECLRGRRGEGTLRAILKEKVRKYFDVWRKMNFLEEVLAKLTGVESQLAHYAMKSSDYSFTQDYVSDRASVWNRYLAELKSKENIQMLEVGSFEGRSAIWFLSNVLTHRSSTITCIDPFPHRIIEFRFDHNVRVSGFSNRVTKIKGRSQDVLRLFREKNFDFVYIDGSHRAEDVQADALLSWSLVKPGGIVIFDDYLWELERPPEDRPQIAIDQFLSDFGSELETLHKGFQVIVRKCPVAVGRNLYCVAS